MNTYQINSVGTGIGTDDASRNALSTSNSAQFLNAIVQMFMIGQNLRVVNNSFSLIEDETIVTIPNTSFVFDSNFSMSNIETSDISFHQIAYDTRVQNVLEVGDKPYAVKGLQAVILTDTNSDDAKIRPNLDDFTKVTIYDAIGKPWSLYIGTINNSKTDFYSPFSDLSANARVMFFDDKQASTKMVAERTAQQIVNTAPTRSTYVAGLASNIARY